MSKPKMSQVVREVVVPADPDGNRQQRRMAKRLGVTRNDRSVPPVTGGSGVESPAPVSGSTPSSPEEGSHHD